MLHFEEAYFKGEEREGFFVESKMKHAWAAQMEMLKMIEEVCAKHSLRYFASGGTCLGAVRHQGFIPWDDDIDIRMLRDDYKKFMVIAEEELPKGFQLLSVYTEAGWAQPLIRVINGNKICFEREWLERWHGCPYVIGVDIIPVDYISRNIEEEELRENLLRVVIGARNMVKGNAPILEATLQWIEENCGIKLDRSKPLDNQLLVLIDRLSQLFSADEADEVAWMYSYVEGTEKKCQKSCFDKQDWMPFETIEIAVPGGKHEFLTALHGDDYMTPKRMTTMHDYPFWVKQEKKYPKKILEQMARQAGIEI